MSQLQIPASAPNRRYVNVEMVLLSTESIWDNSNQKITGINNGVTLSKIIFITNNL